jgi:hypothetical protein
MARYIEFATEEGAPILVEVEAEEVVSAPGVAKAGLRFGQRADERIASAQTTFEQAVKAVVRQNVQSFASAVRDLPRPPTEVEFTFALKATGELGNLAIARIGGEANFTIKLAWKGTDESGR